MPASAAAEEALQLRKAVAQEGAAGHIDWVNETEVHAAWRTDGFVILPGYLSEIELAPALSELGMVFPTEADSTTPQIRGTNATATTSSTESTSSPTRVPS